MSLTARERILKLRETEFKLQKLQNDLLNGNNETAPATMSEFLLHHKELMTMPGSNRDSVPFRFDFQAPKRYAEVKQTQKLTLPPKILSSSVNPLQSLDVLESQTNASPYKIGYRSYVMSKSRSGFPKMDKLSLLSRAPFLKNNKSSKQIKPNSVRSLVKPNKTIKPTLKVESKLGLQSDVTKSKKVKLMWNHQEISETVSTVTESELIFSTEVDDSIIARKTEQDLKRRDSEELKEQESVAYALGTSSLIGVILPSKASNVRRGPSSWKEKKPSKSLGTISAKTKRVDHSDDDDNESISAKEAVIVLRRRKLPERKSPLPDALSPHERGLIGVEISNFEPQCAYFYRDRNGNYNPHLHHSKGVTESMKKGIFGRKKLG